MDWQAINEQRLGEIHPIFATRVRRLLAAVGTPVLITQGLRTWAEQDALYAKGRTAPGPIVTNAPGGHSQHNFGLAVDLCPDDPAMDELQLDWNLSHPVWKTMLEAAPFHGLAEGAQWRTFPDNPHFYPAEIPATTERLRQVYVSGGGENGGMKAVWNWFETLAATSKLDDDADVDAADVDTGMVPDLDGNVSGL